jgi:hypothetical protein
VPSLWAAELLTSNAGPCVVLLAFAGHEEDVMREFTKSTLSFSWAMSLFGFKQLANIVTARNDRSMEEAAGAFDTATQAMGRQFDTMFQGMFQAGDELQREMVDSMLASFTAEGFKVDEVLKGPTGMLQHGAQSLGGLVTRQDGMLVVQELRNKFEVFFLVADVANKLKLPSQPPYPELPELVERAYKLGEYPALWAVEGLGHFYADTFWKGNEVPEGILRGARAEALPAKSLTMLNAGIGMSFAQHLLQSVTHLSPRPKIRSVLQRFIALCRDNATPGYEGAALESLGLVSRSGAFTGDSQPPVLVDIISEELSSLDEEEVRDYFWHGVGRATYFLPIHFIPFYGSITHAADLIMRTAPDERARDNALAGLAWGVAMVNIRHPAIAANWLKQQAADLPTAALANGFASGLMMRRDTTPEAQFSDNFRQYSVAEDPETAILWDKTVAIPCREALEDNYAVLRDQGSLGEIFRNNQLAELCQRPEARTEG